MTAVIPSPTALEMILEWSLNKPAWQRDALRRIVLTGQLNDKDIAELIIICKDSRSGINSSSNLAPLNKEHLPVSPSTAASVSLLSIKDVSGVNLLASGQTLPLEPKGITIIYGDNGAGKSGYSRVLKRVCGARHRDEILANIFASDPPGPATATIGYTVDGVEQPPLMWKDSNYPHSQLSAISIFDKDCASIHIEKENEVAFRPFSLDIPDELARACERIGKVLNDELSKYKMTKSALFVAPPWKEHTIVGKALKALKFDTDMSTLTDLAFLTEDEKIKLEKLKIDLSKDPVNAAAEQIAKADSIKEIIKALTYIENLTNDHALNQIFITNQNSKAKRMAAQIAAQNAFSDEKLKGVGTEAWRELWEAARRYSTQIAYCNYPFPTIHDGSLCVLCQNPLENEGKERMNRFEKYIQDDTERHAQESERITSSQLEPIATQVISTRSLRPYLREVEIQNPGLSKEVRRFLASARLRRYVFLKALANNQGTLALPLLFPNPKERIMQLESSLRAYGLELQQAAASEIRKKLQTELEELSDKDTLSNSLSIVQEEIERLKKIQFLSTCLDDTKTTAITKLGNAIADIIITPKLQDQFKEEIKNLAAARIGVEVARASGKVGLPHYKVRFIEKPTAKVGTILSEGEKTCIALAAFLTELAIAPHNSTLVFDDPIASLDHRFRSQIAKRLVEEAKKRQIIVFTHDLVFFHDLSDWATRNKQITACIAISRGSEGTGVVSQEVPWIAQKIEKRIDKLEKDARASKPFYENHQEEQYRDKAVQCYNKLRSCWENALETVVFAQVILRYRDYINTKYLKKVISLTDDEYNIFEAEFKRCCDITDAHDPSVARNADVPSPNELLKDIEVLNNWVKSLKERSQMN